MMPGAPLISAGLMSSPACEKASRLARDVPGTAPFHRSGLGPRAAVDSVHHVRVQDGDQRIEVAVAGGGEESVNGRPLSGQVAIAGRRRGAADAAPGPAGELAGRLRRALDDRGDLIEWHVEHVVQHVRQPFRRAERLHDDQQPEPDRVGEQRLVLGAGPSAGSMTGSGTCGPNGSSGLLWRARSMFNDTRATIVVSHAPRLSTPLASARDTLSQASWTASSASVSEPSIR